MSADRFSWRSPGFTYADALTGARLVMLPYLIYGLAAALPGLALTTLAAMIATDLIDGRIARRLGQSRPFGAAFDSGIDFIVIYGLFTTYFAIGLLPWWKWAVIVVPALLMAVTQILYLMKAPEVSFAAPPAAKIVGQIQFTYLPVLLVRTFWLRGAWIATVDHVLFAILAIAIVANTIDHARLLAKLLRTPAARTAGRPEGE